MVKGVLHEIAIPILYPFRIYSIPPPLTLLEKHYMDKWEYPHHRLVFNHAHKVYSYQMWLETLLQNLYYVLADIINQQSDKRSLYCFPNKRSSNTYSLSSLVLKYWIIFLLKSAFLNWIISVGKFLNKYFLFHLIISIVSKSKTRIQYLVICYLKTIIV